MTPAAAMELFRALVSALSGVTLTSIYLAYGSQGRPTSAHILITTIDDAEVGPPSPQVGGAILQRRQMRLQIDGFLASAFAGVVRLAPLLRSNDARMLTAGLAGIAIQGVGTVVTRTEWWHTAYEPRAMVDVRVGYEALVSSVQAPVAVDTIILDVNDITIPILEPDP